jgi:hypothetical protein
MSRKLWISAAILALAAAPAAAFAHDESGWYQHQQDHQEHGAFHDEVDAAHAQAHEEGFASEAEHEGYHRALREMHENFHDDHPGTRHDGYRLPRARSYGYGYGPYAYAPDGYGGYSSQSYGYAPSYSYQDPVVSLFFGLGR